MTGPIIRKGNSDADTGGGKMMGGQRERTAEHKPRTEAWSRPLVHSPEKELTWPAPDAASRTLTRSFLLLSHPACGTLSAVALADE